MSRNSLSNLNPSLRSRALLAMVVFISSGLSLYVLYRWMAYDPARALHVSLPGADGRPKGYSGPPRRVNLVGVFQKFDGTPADLPGAWPRFRGADFDNIVKGNTHLAASWGPNGPKVLWKLNLGDGHAAAAVLHGCVYVIDYDEIKRADAIRCFSLADGKEIWRRSYSIMIKRNHGMSRTIPAVTDKYLLSIGPRCDVVCLDPKSGDFKWGISLTDQYGTTEPLWYTGQCALIDHGQAILAPGGPDDLLMAVDCATGKVLWKTPNPNKWLMSHSSIIPTVIAGKRMYIYCAIGGVVGVSAEPGDAGKLLWETPWNAQMIAASPVPLGDGRIFVTAGYGAGAMMIRVTRNGDAFSARVLDKHTPDHGLACEQQTPIYHDGLLYAIMPKDAGALRGQFVCYRPDDTLVWSSGPEKRFGLGPFILADGKFYILSDNGTLTVIDARKNHYDELGHAKVLNGRDAWGPIAIAGTRMIVRDSKHMVCLDMKPGDGS